MTRRLLFTAALLLLLNPLLIFAQTPSPPVTTIDFYGTVDSNLGSTLIINGRVVDISTAQMNSMLLAPGVTVHIVAQVAPNGSLIAQALELVPVGFIPGLVELSGTISEVTEISIRIDDQTIDTTNARIIDLLQVGDQVRVIARATNTTVWEARFVYIDSGIIPPVATPEVIAILPPVTTPEVVVPVAPVVAPVFTPEVSFDDHGGGSGNNGNDDRNDDHGGNSGHGGGSDDSGSDDD